MTNPTYPVPECGKPPSIAEIQHAVCERFGVRLIEMSSARRARSVVRPRQIAMYLARELTLRSLPTIGRFFGNRDHTTVMHACRTIEAICRQDCDCAAVVDALRQQLSGAEQFRLPSTQEQVLAAQYARLVA